MSTVPASKLGSRPIKAVLTENIRGPVLQSNWNVAAFRMHWSRPEINEQTIWDQMVLMREELDKLVKIIPEALFIVSAISATFNQIKTGQKGSYKIRPYVAYWLVSERMTDNRNLCDIMNNNNCGAQVKIMLQPYQTTEQDISNALFNTVKDNVTGCVRRLVEDSSESCYGPSERLREPIVKIFVAKRGPMNMLSQAVVNLAGVRFHAELIKLD